MRPMSSKIVITANNEQKRVSFPVLPEKVNVGGDSNDESLNVVGLGEVTIRQDDPAIPVDFEVELPAESCDGYQIIETLKAMKQNKKPVHFICTNPPVNMYATISKMPYYEQGGDVGTIYLSMSLKEWKEPSVRKVTIVKATSGTIKATVVKAAARVDNREASATYSVVSGDCLYNIAKKKLGDASKWKEIATLNNIKSPYTIYPKQTLKLPG